MECDVDARALEALYAEAGEAGEWEDDGNSAFEVGVDECIDPGESEVSIVDGEEIRDAPAEEDEVADLDLAACISVLSVSFSQFSNRLPIERRA